MKHVGLGFLVFPSSHALRKYAFVQTVIKFTFVQTVFRLNVDIFGKLVRLEVKSRHGA